MWIPDINNRGEAALTRTAKSLNAEATTSLNHGPTWGEGDQGAYRPTRRPDDGTEQGVLRQLLLVLCELSGRSTGVETNVITRLDKGKIAESAPKIRFS